MAAGLISTSQEAGGALGVAVAATIALRRVPELTAAAHGDPVLVLAARASVFHETFLIGSCFAGAGVIIALLLPMMRAAEQPGPAVPVG